MKSIKQIKILTKKFISFIPLTLLLLLHIHFVDGQTKMGYALISPTELNQMITTDKNLVIIDLRKENQYKNEHLPGALNTQKSMFDNEDLDYKGMIAPKDQVEKILGNLGILPASHLVIYDESSDLEAARIWFVLKTYGHKSVQLLDGGFSNWKNLGLPLSSSINTPKHVTYKFPEHSEGEYYATREDVKNVINNPNVVILDVRSDSEYSAGHIPGAININWINNLNDKESFKSKEELIQQFAKAGVTSDKQIITYCRSGTRASHTAFVLRELLGFENVKNFDGSWIEWTHFNEKIEK